MASEVEYKEVLRALLLGDNDRADQLKARMGDSQYEGASELISAAFCVAVEQRFKDDSSPEAVRVFMDEARQNFANASPPLKPLVAEALIRGVLGEEHLLDEVDPDDYVGTQMPIARKIIAESPILQTRIDDLLSDAEKIADHWSSQGD